VAAQVAGCRVPEGSDIRQRVSIGNEQIGIEVRH
jgi:hypothetical protein